MGQFEGMTVTFCIYSQLLIYKIRNKIIFIDSFGGKLTGNKKAGFI